MTRGGGFGLLCCLLVNACASGPAVVKDGNPSHVPVDPWAVPEPQPKAEPRSRYGNPESYEVFGKRYHVLDTAKGYREQGLASWYGTKFHGRRTSSGEPYDMFAMTAAHKTLPLPTYVRVTNLENDRSLVVKVNDRGPFHPGRIIDLSYTAAVRLGVYEKGSARVEVEAINPAVATAPPRATTAVVADAQDDDPLNQLVAKIEAGVQPPASDAGLPFIELCAFRNMSDCLQLEDALKSDNLLAVQVQTRPDSNACRVLQGPFATRKDAGAQLQNLRKLGYQPVITYP